MSTFNIAISAESTHALLAIRGRHVSMYPRSAFSTLWPKWTFKRHGHGFTIHLGIIGICYDKSTTPRAKRWTGANARIAPFAKQKGIPEAPVGVL